MKAPHGTPNRYVNDLCRCDLCRAAHTALYRRRRRERRDAGLCGHCGVRWSGKHFRCGPCADTHAANMAYYRSTKETDATDRLQEDSTAHARS